MNEGKERILVTGATGRLGSALVRRLLKKGFKVRALSRDKMRCAELFGKKCDAVQLDLAKAHVNELFEACFGCAAVVHLAALLDGTTRQLMETNFEATKKLVQAARKAGVKRFVYCSSTAVYGNPRGEVAEESAKNPVNTYGKSKLLAEEAVKAGGVPWIIIRPSVIYGPGFATGFKEVIKMAEKGRLPLIGTGRNRVALVHVDDVVEALLLAVSKKSAENRDFNVSGPPVTQEKCVSLLAGAVSPAPRITKIPKAAAYLAAGAMELFARARGKRKQWREFARVLGEDRVFPAKKAERMLGWKPRRVFEKEAPKILQGVSRQ